MLPLQSAYDTKEAFLRAVPGLIIANNLYGVDIDVRATQIASLALWLRAHRSLAQLRVPSVERGSMGRGNVIAATAPPPEKNLRARVQNALTGSASHGFKALESDFLRLIPETGILLPLEDSLKSVKEASAAAYSREIAGDLFGGEPEGTQLHLVLESSDWDRQRDAVRSALNLYIKEAGHSFQERLFAQDADDCLRLIELCTLKFDAIVMNPPFGSPTDGSRETLGKLFPTTKKEIIGMFILRMIRMLKSGGYVGTISSRTLFFQTSTEKWREEVLFGNTNMPVFLDLGLGVMDGAMVEAAAYVIGSGKSDEKTVFVNAIHAGKSDAMVAFVHDDKNQTVKALDSFESAPGRALVYFAGDDILGVYGNKQYGFVRPSQGLATADNDRYVRLAWEVESAQKSWVPLAKGGEARPFYGDVPTEVNWASDGDEVKKDICFKYPYLKGNYSFVVKNESDYFHPGLTWSHRAQSLQLRVFPKDGIFDRKGCCVFVTNDDTEQLLSTMAILNSRAFQNLVAFRISWVEGNSCYECGLLSSTPFPKFDEDNRKLLAAWAEQNFNARRKLDSVNEESRAFVLPELIQVANEELNREAELKLIIESQDAIDQKADELYGLKSKRIEKQEKSRQLPAPTDLEKKNRLVSWAVGVAFGRFDWRLAIGEREIPAVGGPFDSYPALAPGRLPAGDAPLVPNSGIFVMDPSHSKDLTAAVRQVFQTCFLDDTIDIHEWLVKDFFKFHLGTYSAAARVAPIYWPIGTASGSYVLWLYYPKLSSNMLFGALNEFVDPKLLAETRRYEEMQREASEPTTAQRRELERQAVFIAELNALRDKLQNLANTFNVHFDDGVALNAVRFMPLIQSKDWLKKLEKTKAALEKGELDWSETAADLYPERVRQACKKTPSIKLAHSKRDWFDADEASS